MFATLPLPVCFQLIDQTAQQGFHAGERADMQVGLAVGGIADNIDAGAAVRMVVPGQMHESGKFVAHARRVRTVTF